MRKMIPVYILQILMLAAFLLVGYRISSQLTTIEEKVFTVDQNRNRPARGGGVVTQVEVVNRPIVSVDNTVDVNVVNKPKVTVIGE